MKRDILSAFLTAIGGGLIGLSASAMTGLGGKLMQVDDERALIGFGILLAVLGLAGFLGNTGEKNPPV